MPRHEFQSLAKEHHAGQKLRKTSRWDQSPPCSWHKAFSFPHGSIVECDKGYVDYGWYQALNAAGVYFVRRQKTRTVYRVILNQVVIPGQGVTSDQVIELNGSNQKGIAPQRLRRVSYHDVETGKDSVFLANHVDLAAKAIAGIYKSR